MPDNAEINFDAPATLRKWPSLNNERVSASLGARPYMIIEGTLDVCIQRFMSQPRRVKKMKLLKGDSFPIFLVSDGVSQQTCRGHLSKEVARSSGCRGSVQRFRCSMAVFEPLSGAARAWIVAAWH